MDSTTARSGESAIIGGVDTHKDFHLAAALSDTGRLLGCRPFPTTARGYRDLLAWLQSFGEVGTVGIEGTGSYGAELARFLRQVGIAVVEGDRPNRQWRHRFGKSDPVDAEAAARAVLAGTARGTPKTQAGPVEAIRLLRVARRSAIKARTQAANQLLAIIATAPDELRRTLRSRPVAQVVAVARRYRSAAPTSPKLATKLVLKGLAQRWLLLDAEIRQLDAQLRDLVTAAATALLAVQGVGIDTAGSLLVAAGDNPERLRCEASFAALCGVTPVDASSGRQQRHRLNRGGNRDANRALWVVILARLSHDQRTREYAERRTKEGLTKREIIRCLKRYAAREIYRALRALTPSGLPEPATP